MGQGGYVAHHMPENATKGGGIPGGRNGQKGGRKRNTFALGNKITGKD